jgi:putative ABC transport system ATP-binding protein
MAGEPYILEGRELRKSYGRGPGRAEVLHGCSLRVARGEFLAVMGPSGCGKTTLLNLLGLMSLPDGGEVVYDGRGVSARPGPRNELRRNRIGFVFQRFNLLPPLIGRDNVRMSLKVRGLLGRHERNIDALLTDCGVSDAARRKPAQMSVGEQQRVAVVRALAHQPEVLLADEPTGNLDSENGRSLLELFGRIHHAGQTIVMITHSAEAAAAADRILHMKDGQLHPAD